MAEQSVVPVASFAPLSRSGVVAGLSWAQMVIVAAGVAPTAVRFMGGDLPGGLLQTLWWSLPVVIFGAGSWAGRSYVSRVATLGVFMLRRRLGQTRAVIDPMASRELGRINVPGAVGERVKTLSLVGTRFAGAAFLWDRAAGTATAVLRVATHGWMLADPAVKASRARAFDEMCRALADLAGVVRVVSHARTFPGSRAELDRPGIGSWVDDEYAELLEHPTLGEVLHRDVLIAVTVSKEKVRGEIRAAGGGRAGMSAVLADRIASMLAYLPACGVRTEGAAWLSEAQIRGAVRLAFDPQAASWLAELDGCLPQDAVLTGVVDEKLDHLVTDSAVHKTLWIERWPSTEVPAGYLSELLGGGLFPHVVTQVWEPVPIHKAEVRLRRAESSHSSVARISEKIGRATTSDHDAEARELAQRRQELSLGFGDTKYAGYVTVSAPDLAKLKEAIGYVNTHTGEARLNALRGQQFASFITSLPLGIGPRA
ncbi:SCO6880 family protein [Cellulomonas sp. ES6]|uniref:SCO6880 family protein n=1 Tax=Cellulomonas sp. ES6 TaxID=3039384 RepID=UPI0024B83E54|nr:SCO6880 family protein [Cellulomonas sp. ES6]WHP16599.1 hypothetical protein P9841_13370 [Cellulomonas sp. ES6]